MKYKFENGFQVCMPAALLVEDIQALQLAIRNDSKDLVESVLECLQESLDCYAVIPEGMTVKPSASSIIAPSHKAGIILQENGQDLHCVMHRPVSEAMDGGCQQCSDNCPYLIDGDCAPEKGLICLTSEFTYDAGCSCDDLLDTLDKKDP